MNFSIKISLFLFCYFHIHLIRYINVFNSDNFDIHHHFEKIDNFLYNIVKSIILKIFLKNFCDFVYIKINRNNRF